MSGYNIKDLIQEAQSRWLRPAEVLFILKNYKENELHHEPPQKPPSGSLFLFNKRVLRFFRKDGHSWRTKKNGKNVGEAHERLKVGNEEALNCYYAHGEQNPNFKRRCYWMLDPAMEHIVLVHYRDITIGKHSAEPIYTSTLGPSNIIQPILSAAVEFREPYHNTLGPTSPKISPIVVSNGTTPLNPTKRIEETDNSPEFEIHEALRKIEEQLSLDQMKSYSMNEQQNELGFTMNEHQNLLGFTMNEQQNELRFTMNEHQNELGFTMNEHSYSGSDGLQYGSDDYVSPQYPVVDKAQDQLNISTNCATEYGILHQYQQLPSDEFNIPNQQTFIWNVMQKYNRNTEYDDLLENYGYQNAVEDQGKYHSGDAGTSNDSSISLSQELEDSTFPSYTPAKNMYQSDPDLYTTLFDQGQLGTPLTNDPSLTVSQELKFNIREVSPEWGYATESTKVLIVGSFTCDPSSHDWVCMFGDKEVPIEIIQQGVISCRAPLHLPGKVTICISSGNREACSQIREFEYRDKQNTYAHASSADNESSRTSEELLLLVKCVQILLSDQFKQNGKKSRNDFPESSILGGDEDSWDRVIEALLVDGGLASSPKTLDWLIEQLLKDKLQQWLSNKLRDKDMKNVGLSKKEQGIIHMVSGLDFVWALTPILEAGVGVNYRDGNGWTALHWAARFGREKMVAELLASGAYAGAVTDPTQQDPTGKTAASIAAKYGHNGLAGYLSEVALTTHLSSLTLKESELSKCSADVEAEKTVNSISDTNNLNLVVNEDHLSLKDTLAAVRNATQAASRIQAAFRAHSFKKRRQQEAIDSYVNRREDGYEILPSDMARFSKTVFGNARDHNAALAIQKKYRGWKSRKDFLALRKKVVKIQAHVRGHQARKHYETICWAVGIVEKIVLRWYRKGAGLRGFHLDGNGDEEDLIKVFRKQKVDVALSEAVSRVLSMVNSSQARQQYRRMLEKYRQAKAERGGLESEKGSSSGTSGMETDELYEFLGWNEL